MKNKCVLVLLSVMISSAVFCQQSSTTHTVLKGDNVTQIAQNYKTTPAEIYKLNPEAQKGIVENQILNIPIKPLQPQNTFVHIVESKETIYGLATKYNVKVEAIQSLNSVVLENGLQVGEELFIPLRTIQSTETVIPTNTTHLVKPKESMFSIARLYNVSVEDLNSINSEVIKNGLKIGQEIRIPNKKKTLDGRVRVINNETIFYVVKPKETKFSIARQFGITVAQLESQNPEIVNGLVVGNNLAINIKTVKPSNEREELMIALADKQLLLEKSKSKEVELENLTDKLYVSRQMNQKILKINSLQVDLDQIDATKEGSAERLKMVLEVNKHIQDILVAKLDSLVYKMNEELDGIKNTEITNLEDSKKFERISYDNIRKTNQLATELKQDLASNRNVYSSLMNKAEQVAVAENKIYKQKIRENQSAAASNASISAANINNEMSLEKLTYEQKRRDEMASKYNTIFESIDSQKKVELKRHISKAVFYTQEARDFDDNLALVKLKRYKTKAQESKGTTIENKSEPICKTEEKDYITPRIEVYDNLKEIKNGYYLVIDIFNEASKRDNLIMQLIDSDQLNSSFIYNINALNYFVYTNYHKNLEGVVSEYNQKYGMELYKNMFVVQIEN